MITPKPLPPIDSDDYTLTFDCPRCHKPAIVIVSRSGNNGAMFMRAAHIRGDDTGTGYPRHRCILSK